MNKHLCSIEKKSYPSKKLDLCGCDINEYALNYARNKYRSFTFFDIDDSFFEKELSRFQ